MANNTLYGFHDIKDTSVLATSIATPVINTAIDAAIAYHNRQTAQLLDLFVKPTTEPQQRYAASATTVLQGLDDYGRARKVISGKSYTVGAPIEFAGIAWGAPYYELQKMSVEQVQANTQSMLVADVRWLGGRILTALLANEPFTYQDATYGALNVYGLANGDSITYARNGDATGTDNHYLAQSAAISDAANPLPAFAEALTEHPENTPDVVFFVSPGVMTQISTLATFYPAQDNKLIMPNTQVQVAGKPDLSRFVGRYRGYVANAGYVFEWNTLPNGYGIAVTIGGEKALVMREEQVETLRGFRRYAERSDAPYWECQYIRIAGFGSWNRVGALAFQIGAGSYATPAAFSRQ